MHNSNETLAVILTVFVVWVLYVVLTHKPKPNRRIGDDPK